MRYKYASYLNDLKDLKHVEWFVLHSDEYEFHSLESENLLNRLKKNIQNKNIYYSDILCDYEKLVEQFDNDPYNYVFDTQGEDIEQSVKSGQYENYFIKVRDNKEKRFYTVPYCYVQENPKEIETKVSNANFNTQMENFRKRAFENLQAVMDHYQEYWNSGGVKAAMERYETVGYGKGYRLPKTIFMYFLYNIMLFMIMAETRYFCTLTHFWQILSKEPTAVYSAMNLFSGHRFLGTVLFLAITYFVVMDIHYSYGIYYLIFINKKYQDVMKYHQKVSALFGTFGEDYELCKNGINEKILMKRYHRDSVYVPMILMANRRYDFMVERAKLEEDEDGKKVSRKKRGEESIIVPDKSFYSHPLRKRLIWILFMLVIVQAACNSNMILFH